MEGSALKAKRTELGYTQEELARKLGVAANTVARWERGEGAIPPFLELALKSVKKNVKKN